MKIRASRDFAAASKCEWGRVAGASYCRARSLALRWESLPYLALRYGPPNCGRVHFPRAWARGRVWEGGGGQRGGVGRGRSAGSQLSRALLPLPAGSPAHIPEEGGALYSPCRHPNL